MENMDPPFHRHPMVRFIDGEACTASGWKTTTGSPADQFFYIAQQINLGAIDMN